jgi:uncharacterized protein (DUF486 family)
MKAAITIGLLIISNVFMTLAWYGHLKFKGVEQLRNLPLWGVVLLSWAIALLEYRFQVPANRIGSQEYGGPLFLLQLKIIQEVLTLLIFVVFSLLVFKNEQLRLNHLWGFFCLLGAVYFFFKK